MKPLRLAASSILLFVTAMLTGCGASRLELQYFPIEDITLVVFCNQNNGAFDDLKKYASRLITGFR